MGDRYEQHAKMVRFISKRYAIDENIVNLDHEVRSFRQVGLSPTIFVQHLLCRTSRSGSVFDEMTLTEMFVEGGQSLVRTALRH